MSFLAVKRTSLIYLLLFMAAGVGSVAAAPAMRLASPNGQLVAVVEIGEDGAPRYTIERNGKPVLQQSKLGLVREDADFSRGLQLLGTSRVEPVEDRYEMLTSKRRWSTYRANRQVLNLQTAQAQKLDIIFQVSDDGVAFRYHFPETSSQSYRIREEVTSFNFLPDTRTWLQPIAVAKTGFAETNPSYEEFYERDGTVGIPSPTGAGWVYPALFRTADTWLLVSETAVGRNYAATRLRNEWRSTEYRVGFPDPREHFQGGPVNPESTLPWLTPWRLIVVGDLKTIVESTLGTDLADKPAADARVPAPGPGKASWSWPLLGDGHTIYETQKRFIDYAAEMGWRYTLIDALWDTQIGDEKVKELVDYARSKGVAILLWYNSAGDWNTAPQTPRDKLLTRESRQREFERVKALGAVGLKVDFWPGDGQSAMAYYHDMLEESGRAGLLMNFHGSTLPRGWHRTYPHLMTMEAVKGLEFVTFDQRNAEAEPTHAAMLPFTRNVFEPMDFTPVVLDRINNIERRTSSAFELALAVLFTSGIQHYAEIPEGMARAPEYVRDFLKAVPSVWDDVRFIDGFPGQYVVIARRSGERWYVAGINGEKQPREVELDLASLGARGAALITDGDGGNLSFRRESVKAGKAPLKLKLAPRGGFVLTTE
jgi:alpha-glucosidase